MLVLTRKPEEELVIRLKTGVDKDDHIVITILKIQGGKVSLGIEADKKWEILRQELIEPKQTQETQVEVRELEVSLVE